MTTPPRGFSGPVQLNGIGRKHVKAPLAAANGHEWSRSTAIKSAVKEVLSSGLAYNVYLTASKTVPLTPYTLFQNGGK